MKRYLILVTAFFTLLIISCNKDKIDNTEDRVGISKVTRFPILIMEGDNVMAVEKGAAFTDPGVTAKVGESDVPVTTNGTVNINKTGVYTVTYSAVNSDGFSASVKRTVAVYSTAADAAAHDLSGDYARTSNDLVATWTKIAPGVYKVVDPGGAGSNLTVVVFNPEGFTFFIPAQIASDGSITSSKDESYTDSKPPKYTWTIVNPGYGTAPRTFVKQ